MQALCLLHVIRTRIGNNAGVGVRGATPEAASLQLAQQPRNGALVPSRIEPRYAAARAVRKYWKSGSSYVRRARWRINFGDLRHLARYLLSLHRCSDDMFMRERLRRERECQFLFR
jgi:hypothetical protein